MQVSPDRYAHRWQSLIFYLYTGDVAFLPLSSDPSQSREVVAEQYLADHPHDPPPCSPKSMYRLAEKVGRSFSASLVDSAD